MCTTQNGLRCTRAALPNSRYCKQHQTCVANATEGDEIQETSMATMNNLKILVDDVKNLIRERNFYYRKLVKIESFAETLPDTKKKKILKILRQRSE